MAGQFNEQDRRRIEELEEKVEPLIREFDRITTELKIQAMERHSTTTAALATLSSKQDKLASDIILEIKNMNKKLDEVQNRNGLITVIIGFVGGIISTIIASLFKGIVK